MIIQLNLIYIALLTLDTVTKQFYKNPYIVIDVYQHTLGVFVGKILGFFFCPLPNSNVGSSANRCEEVFFIIISLNI